jgi:hypothetical protein
MSDTMNMQTTIIEGTATERTLSVVAAEINVIKRQTAEIINRSVFEIGKRLCEAKALIGHGNWGAWLQENVDYSETTARSMMRIYQEMGGEQVDLITGEAPIDVFETLNMSQMVALFPLRPEERIEFVKENDVADKSVRQIEELVRKVKDAEARAAQEREDKNQKVMEARAAELEAGKLTGIEPSIDNLEVMAERLLELGVRERVIIHMPEIGICRSRAGLVKRPSYALPKGYVKGKTGAGDAFCSGALIAIERGASDEEILILAEAAAVASLSEADATSGLKEEKYLPRCAEDLKG